MPAMDNEFPGLRAMLRGLSDAPAWYVGYSGGLDSTVLLHLLHDWSLHHAAPPLRAVHVNHGMQSSADTWAVHCADNCAALAVPLVTRTVSVTGGEAGARAARYAEFESCLGEGAILFLAHHLDDQ
ncbi:MAG: tRNA(Ile)-lysidine synthetase, partial [Halioglobus sp.]|nr:tRNA(Ile)-lysidine synthetase [Halioglobus sp.]